jgi:hypothetical protein
VSLDRPSSTTTGSTSKSTTGTLSTTTAVKMNDQFVHNFQEFRGTPWLLPSGKNVDEALCQYTATLKKESALHSFVIDKLNIVLSLFDKDDQEDIRDLIDNGDKKLLKTCTVPEWQIRQNSYPKCWPADGRSRIMMWRKYHLGE